MIWGSAWWIEMPGSAPDYVERLGEADPTRECKILAGRTSADRSRQGLARLDGHLEHQS